MTKVNHKVSILTLFHPCTHALNKVLTLNISRQTKTPLVIIANDARSCYDRIILLAAYLAMLKFGIPKETAQSMITAIAIHIHIQTVIATVNILQAVIIIRMKTSMTIAMPSTKALKQLQAAKLQSHQLLTRELPRMNMLTPPKTNLGMNISTKAMHPRKERLQKQVRHMSTSISPRMDMAILMGMVTAMDTRIPDLEEKSKTHKKKWM